MTVAFPGHTHLPFGTLILVGHEASDEFAYRIYSLVIAMHKESKGLNERFPHVRKPVFGVSS